MNRVTGYLRSAYDELVHKVTWPTWKELQSSAIVVLVSSLAFAIMVWLMDYVMGSHPPMAWIGFKGVMAHIYDILR